MTPQPMLKTLLWIVCLVAANVLAGPLAFRPAQGSTLTKSFNQDWKIRLDRLSIVVDGVDFLWTVFAGLSLETELAQRVVVTDTYHSVRRGESTALDREFDELAEEFEISLGGVTPWIGEWNEWDVVLGTSELEDTIVQFRGGPEATTKSFHPADWRSDDELLDGLTEDMDLRVLLPRYVVQVGDTWDLELASLPDLLSPGGFFSWDLEAGGTGSLLTNTLDPALMGELRHVLGDLLEGDATVTYVSEHDGFSQLDVAIEVEVIAGTDDLTELATKILAGMPEWGSFEIEDLCIHLVLEATGTAYWDTERGHISDLELTGDLESAMELTLLWDISGEWVIEIDTEVSAEFEMTVETE